MGLSTSGNSLSVIEGLQAAPQRRLTTGGLTGHPGGALKELVDFCLCVPAAVTPRLQEAHILVGHSLGEIIERELFPPPRQGNREGKPSRLICSKGRGHAPDRQREETHLPRPRRAPRLLVRSWTGRKRRGGRLAGAGNASGVSQRSPARQNSNRRRDPGIPGGEAILRRRP